MILTKKYLRDFLENNRMFIPKTVEQKLLIEYGSLVNDGEGNIFEYTEQDILEQLRKKLAQYENSYSKPYYFLGSDVKKY